MPKTHGDLWKQIISFDTLCGAFSQARLGKRYTPEALRFASRLEENLINIQNHLSWGTRSSPAARGSCPDAPESNTPKEQKTQMKHIYEAFRKWSIEEKAVPENKVWSMRALGSDFGNRTDIHRVSPKNSVFYNITIKPEWREKEQSQF